MNAQQDIQIVHRINYTRKQLRLFYLLLGGTTLLLIWLSVGLGPPTWWLLVQIVRQFGKLWLQQGAVVLWSLLLLVAQSLLLLGAWVLLIRIAIHGSSYFYALLPEAASSAHPLGIAKSSPVMQQNSITVTPFQPISSVLPHPARATPSPSASRDAWASHATYVPPAFGTQVKPATDRGQASQNVHTSEFETQYTPSLLRSEKQHVTPPEPDSTQKMQRSKAVSSDPFAVHEDVLKMFAQENPSQRAKEQLDQTHAGKDQDQSFVFGNPFDGPLPDIFEHDEDLKRSITQQNSDPLSGHHS